MTTQCKLHLEIDRVNDTSEDCFNNLEWLQTHSISMKAFAAALNTNAATFSLSLREPRHWFDSSVTVRCRCHKSFILCH
jgi:hypothetical protein